MTIVGLFYIFTCAVITPCHDKVFFSHFYTEKKEEREIPFPDPSPNPNPNCNTTP